MKKHLSRFAQGLCNDDKMMAKENVTLEQATVLYSWSFRGAYLRVVKMSFKNSIVESLKCDCANIRKHNRTPIRGSAK